MKWIAGGEYLIEMTNGTGKWQLTIMNVSMDECVYNTLWHNLKTNEKIEHRDTYDSLQKIVNDNYRITHLNGNTFDDKLFEL